MAVAEHAAIASFGVTILHMLGVLSALCSTKTRVYSGVATTYLFSVGSTVDVGGGSVARRKRRSASRRRVAASCDVHQQPIVGGGGGGDDDDSTRR